jgi:hypothetical protein
MPADACWGLQFGGIHAADAGEGCAGKICLEEVSPDHVDRIDDFLRRHGVRVGTEWTSMDMDGGYRGCREIHAADGYVLRMEWSRNELRRTLLIVEEYRPLSAESR